VPCYTGASTPKIANLFFREPQGPPGAGNGCRGNRFLVGRMRKPRCIGSKWGINPIGERTTRSENRYHRGENQRHCRPVRSERKSRNNAAHRSSGGQLMSFSNKQNQPVHVSVSTSGRGDAVFKSVGPHWKQHVYTRQRTQTNSIEPSSRRPSARCVRYKSGSRAGAGLLEGLGRNGTRRPLSPRRMPPR
jgi:hypothetical protein